MTPIVKFLWLIPALPLLAAGISSLLSKKQRIPAAALAIGSMIQRVFCGPLKHNWTQWQDLTIAERLTAAPLVIAMFLIGIFPQLVLGIINPTVVEMVKLLNN